MNKQLCLITIIGLFAGGCGVFGGGNQPTQAVDESGEVWQVSRVSADLSPQETMRRAINACRRLQLTPPKSSGFFSGEPDPNNWPTQADYFSAKAAARTIAGETIELMASWQGSNESQLTVRSKLAQNQHIRLVAAIREELNKPAAK